MSRLTATLLASLVALSVVSAAPTSSREALLALDIAPALLPLFTQTSDFGPSKTKREDDETEEDSYFDSYEGGVGGAASFDEPIVKRSSVHSGSATYTEEGIVCHFIVSSNPSLPVWWTDVDLFSNTGSLRLDS